MTALPPRWRRRQALLALLLLPAARPAAVVAAPGVMLAGRMGERALLVIDGRTRVVAVGQTIDDTRLLRWEGEIAVVEHRGTVLALRLASAGPSVAGAPARAAAAREVVIPVGSGGHFMTDGAINGRAVRFMIDTGATLVSMGRGEAERLGLDLRRARPAEAQSAGGRLSVLQITLASLRIGEVELAGVAAIVTPIDMPYVLLGNSVLERFQMRRENDVMRLELR